VFSQPPAPPHQPQAPLPRAAASLGGGRFRRAGLGTEEVMTTSSHKEHGRGGARGQKWGG